VAEHGGGADGVTWQWGASLHRQATVEGGDGSAELEVGIVGGAAATIASDRRRLGGDEGLAV
jgi:hypothetical protein